MERTTTFLLLFPSLPAPPLLLLTDGGLSFLGKMDPFLDRVPCSSGNRSTCQDHS
uniref:Uncharacterized protein n=1 Tax=Amphimedon queenslandica TaxID=400682 RepID=A0A1X7T0T0_AMPQE